MSDNGLKSALGVNVDSKFKTSLASKIKDGERAGMAAIAKISDALSDTGMSKEQAVSMSTGNVQVITPKNAASLHKYWNAVYQYQGSGGYPDAQISKAIEISSGGVSAAAMGDVKKEHEQAYNRCKAARDKVWNAAGPTPHAMLEKLAAIKK